ncbi:hypothetical protein [Kitasatospora mediocidica]|uniref:hypothetical protein n=1 Tax=Kitasatospora mediocidica TaxID=58352 RepID=UPI000691F54B|nr:hypothetical protein [Kitasatospora mediocidica]
MASHRKPRSRPALFSPRIARAARTARTAAGVAGVTMAGAVSLTHLAAVGPADQAPEPGPAVSSAALPSAPTRADLLDQEADRTGPPLSPPPAPVSTPAPAPRRGALSGGRQQGHGEVLAAPLLFDPADDPQAVLEGSWRLDRAASLTQGLQARFGLPAQPAPNAPSA